SRKKKSKTACDPYQPASDPGCTGLEQTWCITLAYNDVPTRPITPLRNGSGSGSSRCGCGGGAGCGCGWSGMSFTNGAAQANGCTPAKPKTSIPASCEPTRILESYQVGVIEEPKECGTGLRAGILNGTLFEAIINCATTVFEYRSNLPSKYAEI